MAEVVAGTSSKVYRRAWSEARRNKVRMVCAVCDRDVEVFTYNPVTRTWMPREPKYDPPRPTGLIYPSEDERVRGLSAAGLLVFRCHRRCGRVEPLARDEIEAKCWVATAQNSGRFEF